MLSSKKFHIVEHCSKYWYDPVRHANLRLLAFRGSYRPYGELLTLSNADLRRVVSGFETQYRSIAGPRLPFWASQGSKGQTDCVLSRQHSRS
jgi:hypothetical protein